MHTSDTPTKRIQAPALLMRRGMTRRVEFGEAGTTATTVSRMERAGDIVRLARALYQLPDAALDAQQSQAEAACVLSPGRRRMIALCQEAVPAHPTRSPTGPRF